MKITITNVHNKCNRLSHGTKRPASCCCCCTRKARNCSRMRRKCSIIKLVKCVRRPAQTSKSSNRCDALTVLTLIWGALICTFTFCYRNKPRREVSVDIFHFFYCQVVTSQAHSGLSEWQLINCNKLIEFYSAGPAPLRTPERTWIIMDSWFNYHQHHVVRHGMRDHSWVASKHGKQSQLLYTANQINLSILRGANPSRWTWSMSRRYS